MTVQPFHFCIIERDLFIAADLGAGLELASPGCHIRKLGRIGELNGELPAPGTIFITKLSLADIAAAGLTDLSRRIEGRIVLRGDTDPADDVRRNGHECLPSPFTNQDLRELVERLTRPAAAAE